MKRNILRKKSNIICVVFFALCFIALVFVVKDNNVSKFEEYKSESLKITKLVIDNPISDTKTPKPTNTPCSNYSYSNCPGRCYKWNNACHSTAQQTTSATATAKATATTKATTKATATQTPCSQYPPYNCPSRCYKTGTACQNPTAVPKATTTAKATTKATATPKPCSQYPPYDCPSRCYKTGTACQNPTATPKTTPSQTCEQMCIQETGSEYASGYSACLAECRKGVGATPSPTPTPGECSVSAKLNGQRFSVGDTVTATVTVSGKCDSAFSISTNISGCASSLKSGSTSCSTKAIECRSYNISASGNGKSSSASSDVVRKTWNGAGDNSFDTKPPKSADDANDKGSDVYATNCTYIGGKYQCTDVHRRDKTSCGGQTDPPRTPTPKPSPTPTSKADTYDFCCVNESTGSRAYYTKQKSRKCPSSNYVIADIPKEECNNRACYANAPTLSSATDAGIQDDKSVARPYMIEGIYTAEACKPPEPAPEICVPTSYGPKKQDKTTNSCEQTLKMTYTDGSNCQSSNKNAKPFYTIACTTDSNVAFDFGDDKGTSNPITSVYGLYAGRGFKFAINVTSTRTCEATFDVETWNSAYKRTQDIIADADSHLALSLSEATKKEYKSIKNEMLELQDNLKKIVEAYNSYDFKNDYKEATTLKLPYSVNGKTVTITKNFETKVTEGSGEYTSKSGELAIIASGVTKPVNYTWSNAKNPRVVKLMPPKTYIDRNTGEITTDMTNAIDGGNKIYIDYDVDPTKDNDYYTLDITVTGIAGNSEVRNKKCKIAVGSTSILYRPIDVKNPFINNEWCSDGKCQNWANSLYDFTRVIHSTTWSEKSMYTIGLSKTDIEDLQKSNENNASNAPYLGLCERFPSNMRDKITNKICDMIK